MDNQAFKIEVTAIVLHFVITMGVLGGYLYTVSIGKPDETLKNLLLLIGGYWFGVLGKGILTSGTKGKPPNDDGHA